MDALPLSDQVPHDHPLHWRAGQAFRWLQWRCGLDYWTDDERESARCFLDIAEVATLRDFEGVSAMVADHPDQHALAGAAVWLVAAAMDSSPDGVGLIHQWLKPEPGPDACELQLVNYRARAEVIGFAVALVQLLTIPVERIGECDPYCRVTRCHTPVTLHTITAAYLLGALYETRPLIFEEMRRQLTDNQPKGQTS